MKKILRATMIALLALVCGQATAVTVTFDPAVDKGTQEGSSQGEDQVSKDGITIMVTPKGSFGNGNQYRVYKGSQFIIKSTIGNITSVSLTCSGKNTEQYGPGLLEDCSTGTYTYSDNNGYWTGDAAEITWTANTAQARITSISVTVGAATPQPLQILGTTPFTSSTTVTIVPSNPDFAVYYTTDGSDPVTSSTAKTYSKPFTLTETTTVKAYEEDYDGNESEVVTKVFEKTEVQGATGSGTLNDPFNYIAAANMASALEVGTVSDQDYYIKGKISSIKYTFSAQYGTATFYITDDGTETDQFCIYATYFLENKSWVDGNTQIKVGDDVIIYGKLTNYNGTPETASKQSYLYSLNGKTSEESVNPQPQEPTGTGTLDDPFNYIAAANLASSLEQGAVTDQDYYIKGKISSIKYTFSAQYGTATFYITDDGTETNQFCIYATYYLENKPWEEGNTQIKVGDNVIICGKLTNYNGTPETASKQSYLYSLNGKTTEGGVDPQPQEGTGTGTLDDPFNYIAAASLASSLEQGAVTDKDYYIKGKISSIKYTYSAQYGTATFYITDDGTETNQFCIYATYYLENKPWEEGNTQIKVGDDVIICGKLTNYNGTPETASKQSYLYSLNGKTSEEGVDPQPQEPTGTGTLEDPFNSVAANNLASSLEAGGVTDQAYYIKGKIASIPNNGYFGEKYGNATFYISDDGTEAGQFYVFRTLYLENKPWVAGNTQIKVGDEVIVYGKLTNYNGTTPETVQGETYLYSLNGKTSEGGVDPQPQEGTGTGTLDDPFNYVAAASLASLLEQGAVTDKDYYIKGKISSIKYTYSAQYGTATFYITDDGTETDQFCIYATYFLENKPWVEGNTQIKVGDDVIICGKLTNYNGTPETASKQSYLYSLNGKTSEESQQMPVAADIAAFKAMEDGTEAILTLTDAQVLYVGQRDVYVRDASGALDFYNLGLEFEAGQVLNGKIIGKRATYNSIPEMGKTSDTNDSEITRTAGTAQPKTVTIAEARSEVYYCDLIRIENTTLEVVVPEEGSTAYYAHQGDNVLQVFDKFGVGYDFVNEDPATTYSFDGILVPWKGDYELYFTRVDVVTGIENAIVTSTADAPRYNIAGQRVSDSYKGVVIQNGHKFVQK